MASRRGFTDADVARLQTQGARVLEVREAPKPPRRAARATERCDLCTDFATIAGMVCTADGWRTYARCGLEEHRASIPQPLLDVSDPREGPCKQSEVSS